MTSTSPAVQVRSATTADLQTIRAWLQMESLPHSDLTPASPIVLLVALDADRPVGAIGIERFGTTGLLRSLVVAPGHRRAGVGRALVAALEDLAQRDGLELMVLLTTTAEAFFVARGYRTTARGDLPEAVRTHAEFREWCPASAACLSHRLNPASAP